MGRAGRHYRIAILTVGCLLVAVVGCCGRPMRVADDAGEQIETIPYRRGGALSGAQAPREVIYYQHPKFHPVPTRPVFSNRDHELALIEGQMFQPQSYQSDSMPVDTDLPWSGGPVLVPVDDPPPPPKSVPARPGAPAPTLTPTRISSPAPIPTPTWISTPAPAPISHPAPAPALAPTPAKAPAPITTESEQAANPRQSSTGSYRPITASARSSTHSRSLPVDGWHASQGRPVGMVFSSPPVSK